MIKSIVLVLFLISLGYSVFPSSETRDVKVLHCSIVMPMDLNYTCEK